MHRLTAFLILALTVQLRAVAFEEREPVAGKLNLITVNEDKIEGKFYSEDGAGIHFVSDSNRLTISVIEDIDATEEPLLAIESYSGRKLSSMVSVLGVNFLLQTDSPNGEITDYAVPSWLVKRVKGSITSSHPKRIERVKQQLSRDTADSREDAFRRLAMRPEVRLVEAAATAMGKEGIVGSDNRAAMKFYLAALRLVVWSDPDLSMNRENSDVEEDADVTPAQTPDDRWSRAVRRCAHGLYCGPLRCPGRGCRGMCGRGCSCWWIICRTCCWTQGCYDHDNCCARYGYFSWACIRAFIPWFGGFSCSGYSC